MGITLNDLYVAYRKAKVEAYYESNVAHGLKFVEFESDLQRNLERLLSDLNGGAGSWANDVNRIGCLSTIPREPLQDPKTAPWHFVDSDPLSGWASGPGHNQPVLIFRPVIDATVEFLIIATLWVLKVGWLLDRELSSIHVFANRINRSHYQHGPPNTSSHKLFRNWVTQYDRWLRRGLDDANDYIRDVGPATIFHLDLKRFYHEIDAAFVQKAVDALPEAQSDPFLSQLTRDLIRAKQRWSEEFIGSTTGLPVGLVSSAVIANALLKQFDEEVAALSPVHYGRYVDDICLVVPTPSGVDSVESALTWLAAQVPSLSFDPSADPADALSLNLRDHAKLMFATSKISVMNLVGEHGQDLLLAVQEQLAKRASEQRLKPPLPDDPAELGRRALMLIDANNREVGELRHARKLALRRAALTQMLRLMERYDSDLPPPAWRKIRTAFYGLVQRHAITPAGLHLYFHRLPWLFGLMVSCRDYSEAQALLNQLRIVRETAAVDSASDAVLFWRSMCRRFMQAAIASIAMRPADASEIRSLLRSVRSTLAPSDPVPSDNVEEIATALLLADWARIPYAEKWVAGGGEDDQSPAPPGTLAAGVDLFIGYANLPRPDWRPIAFPTRPLTPFDITTRLSTTALNDLQQIIHAFRGNDTYGIDVEVTPEPRGDLHRIRVGTPDRTKRRNIDSAIIAVTSMLTTDDEWEESLMSPVPLTIGRYHRLRELIKDTLSAKGPVDYLVLPELSLPRAWVQVLTEHLARYGVSLLAGVEYDVVGATVKNEAVISLWSDTKPSFPIVRFETKTAPAWHERDELQTPSHPKPSRGPFRLLPGGKPNLYDHGGFHFATLICSDLTNVDLRAPLRGQVDALFVLEWNPDVDTFGSMVESSSTDLHSFVVQVNNRQFGDSWIRAPFCDRYRRDILRVKGGLEDYVVLGRINFQQLRDFQANRPTMSCDQQRKQGFEPGFKPVPIGYLLHPLRRP